jgi:hypothetical protein
MAEEKRLIPRSFGIRDCDDPTPVGDVPSYVYDFVQKLSNQDKEPLPPEIEKISDRCDPWYYYNMKVGNLLALENIQANGRIVANGDVYSNGGGHRLSAKKNFDIPHPIKNGWRLRHTCLEGPENGVYFRGKLKDSNYIDLPEYWKKLVDTESINVNLTPMGTYQELYYEISDCGTKIKVINNSGGTINCSYIIYGERIDGEKLIVEYEGDSPADYPGNNDEYSVVGWNYDVRI